MVTNTLDREIGRRVWWYLTWLDVSTPSMPPVLSRRHALNTPYNLFAQVSHALSHGGCYSIIPAHNATAEPMNVDDDVLNNDGHATPKALNEYTVSPRCVGVAGLAQSDARS